MRIVCAMSGGVDSSIAAAALRDQGHEVIGMTMRLYDVDPTSRQGKGGSCCSPAEVDLAKVVCGKLGIAHYTVDERGDFGRFVIDDFVREYAAGRTPNPCARCNQHIKFAPLLARAKALGAEVLATGHYARMIDGQLWRATDLAKDQSYFLFAMGAERLRQVVFPLGEMTKGEVRARAQELGMPNWNHAESQELCFVPSADHGDVVEARAEALGLDPETLGEGPIVDTDGRELGRHRGIHRVTVGQRRGLRVSGDKPRYVLRVVPETRTVVVGDAERLQVRRIRVREVQSYGLDPAATLDAQVQIRHRSRPTAARICMDGSTASVEFDAPVRAVAAGQAAVFYDGDRVLGGGWIAETDVA